MGITLIAPQKQTTLTIFFQSFIIVYPPNIPARCAEAGKVICFKIVTDMLTEHSFIVTTFLIFVKISKKILSKK